MTFEKKKAPYGTWESPLKASDIASSAIRLGQVLYGGDKLYWLEGRPKEGGRSALVAKDASGQMADQLDQSYNLRSLVHEYGGGAYLPLRDSLFFINYKDQRIYTAGGSDRNDVRVVTAEGPYRFADMSANSDNSRIYCVMEKHSEDGEEPTNSIALIDVSKVSSVDFEIQEPIEVASSCDFYACPRVSPDGRFLAWYQWNHPNMPWDGTKLMVAEIKEDGSLGKPVHIAGNEDESIFQPSWSPEGQLHFVSDRTGFWNIYKLNTDLGAINDGTVSVTNLAKMEKEFGLPLWVFGMSTYDFLGDGTIVCCYCEKGVWKLAKIVDGEFQPVECPYTDIQYICSNGEKVAMLASSPTSGSSVVVFDPGKNSFEVVKEGASIELDEAYISVPEIIEFPSASGQTSFAFYYPPKNKKFEGMDGELPPLLVKSHGGPTGATTSGLNLAFQYWTSRGFAVVDVNYGGSTGYGRKYMKRLELNWGVVDVDDCEKAALYLVADGKADKQKLAITGGSAGGYTTLCVLTFKDTFKAGASHYGIGDLEMLARDTHKFESRYGDRLIGPYPEMKERYIERSPINHTEKLSCPLIVFQGLEDKVVPPNQAEMMVKAVEEKQLPVAYIAYEGEQHGFRKAENIERTLEAEFYFYAKIFGFEPHDSIQPVPIANS